MLRMPANLFFSSKYRATFFDHTPMFSNNAPGTFVLSIQVSLNCHYTAWQIVALTMPREDMPAEMIFCQLDDLLKIA